MNTKFGAIANSIFSHRGVIILVGDGSTMLDAKLIDHLPHDGTFVDSIFVDSIIGRVFNLNEKVFLLGFHPDLQTSTNATHKHPHATYIAAA